jgi:hypothetical protein
MVRWANVPRPMVAKASLRGRTGAEESRRYMMSRI